MRQLLFALASAGALAAVTPAGAALTSEPPTDVCSLSADASLCNGLEALDPLQVERSDASTAPALRSESVAATTGLARLDVRRLAINAGPGKIPEPATWALMLIGFGALGVSLRRRPRLAQAA